MMARSTCSNQRPDTLMQDRICQVDETSCNARPDHTSGSNATGPADHTLPLDVRFTPKANEFVRDGKCREGATASIAACRWQTKMSRTMPGLESSGEKSISNSQPRRHPS